jgi:4-amino-4-deoxy-L-arabinose transferase-like glycosyltransferase
VRIGIIVLFLVSSYVLFFYRLAERDLLSSHEARAAQDAQTILSDGRWGLPALFDRKVELQKPPLYYWMVAASAWLRGGSVDALAVRLPAALSAVGGALVVYLLGVARGRRRAGAIAAAMLLTMLHYTWLGRVGRIDMPLSLTSSVVMTAFYLGHCAMIESRESRAWRWFLLAYVAAGHVALLKGPIGIVLCAAGIGAYLLLERRLPAPWKPMEWLGVLRRYGLGWGIVVVLLIAAPWYLSANFRTGGAFFDVFFWKHNLERGLGGGSLAAHPWWFYAPRLAIDTAPWSLLLPIVAWLCVRRGWWACDSEARFGLTWLVAMLVILSCSQFKRADYLLPAYPGAALFLGSTTERWLAESANKKILAAVFASVVACCLAGWVVFAGLLTSSSPYVLPWEARAQADDLVHGKRRRAYGDAEKQFAAEIRRRAPAPQLILFFRTEDHALAFHVGRPIDTILEWENLDTWAARPEIYHIVMPSEYAAQWPKRLKKGRLTEVICSAIRGGSNHSDPLVLLRTHPEAESPIP